MAKKSKIATPAWITEGYDSPEAYEKTKGVATKGKSSGKTFKLRLCPKCSSDEVGVLITGEEGKSKGEWECRSCKWTGKDVVQKELSEEEFMKYLDEKGEDVS